MASARSSRTVPMAASIAVIGAASLLCAAAWGAEVTRTESGSTLVVPQEAASQGTVYYVLPGKDAQATFTSDAPLEHIKGTSNRVVGYAVAPTDGPKGALLTGAFALPVDSLDTGIPMRNEHLQSEGWMNSQSWPDVVFTLERTTDHKVEKEADGFTTWSLNLVGTMSMHGVSKEMTIPARITSMPASDKTKARAPGDLLALRAAFTVKMSDFDIATSNPAMQSGKVSDTIELDTFLLFSTVSPDETRRSR